MMVRLVCLPKTPQPYCTSRTSTTLHLTSVPSLSTYCLSRSMLCTKNSSNTMTSPGLSTIWTKYAPTSPFPALCPSQRTLSALSTLPAQLTGMSTQAHKYNDPPNIAHALSSQRLGVEPTSFATRGFGGLHYRAFDSSVVHVIRVCIPTEAIQPKVTKVHCWPRFSLLTTTNRIYRPSARRL